MANVKDKVRGNGAELAQRWFQCRCLKRRFLFSEGLPMQIKKLMSQCFLELVSLFSLFGRP